MAIIEIMTCPECAMISGQIIDKDALCKEYEHWCYMQCTACNLKWHVCLNHLLKWSWANSANVLRNFLGGKHPSLADQTSSSLDASTHTNMNNNKSPISLPIIPHTDEVNNTEDSILVDRDTSCDGSTYNTQTVPVTDAISYITHTDWQSLASHSAWNFSWC